jgi:hypothetical protein
VAQHLQNKPKLLHAGFVKSGGRFFVHIFRGKFRGKFFLQKSWGKLDSSAEMIFSKNNFPNKFRGKLFSAEKSARKIGSSFCIFFPPKFENVMF